MNKLITVNIGSVRFDIEENAYLKLQAYLSDVDKLFSKKYPEVVEDIETRIAEKLYSKQANSKVIKLADIEKLIKSLGSPADLNYETDSDHETSQSSKESQFNFGKKLFASNDDVVIAGVCAGLASYFGIEAVWVRLIFVLSFFSGFLSPIVLVGYIFFWIVLPKATSVTDKMLMKGEELNLSNLQASLKNGVESSKSLLKKNSGKVEGSLNKFFSFLRSLVEPFKNFINKITPILRKVIGFCLILFAIASIVGLLVASGLPFYLSDAAFLPIEYHLYITPILLPVIALTAALILIPLIFVYQIGYSLWKGKNILTLSRFIIFSIVWLLSLGGLVFLFFPYLLLFTY